MASEQINYRRATHPDITDYFERKTNPGSSMPRHSPALADLCACVCIVLNLLLHAASPVFLYCVRYEGRLFTSFTLLYSPSFISGAPPVRASHNRLNSSVNLDPLRASSPCPSLTFQLSYTISASPQAFAHRCGYRPGPDSRRGWCRCSTG
jgi:hypothetical protein